MNDLESKIKNLRVPQRSGEYWEAFPQRILTELRVAPAQRPTHQSFVSAFWWGGRLALSCAMFMFCLWQSRMPVALSHALRRDEKELRQSVARFHDNLGRLMQDEHGLDRLVADQP